MMSGPVSRIWPSGMPCFLNACSYSHISADCPTAAAACFSGIDWGRPLRPRRATPVAMAPEDTRATSRLSWTSAARSPARRPIVSLDGPSPGVVTSPLPTFTTTRRARISARRASMARSRRAGPSRGPARAGLPRPHDAERGHERRKRIVGDLGLGRGEPRDQRGLARVGEPDHPHVGQELQLEVDPPLLARPPQVGAARGAIGRGGEAGIAAPAAGSAGDLEPLPGLGEVAQRQAAVPLGDRGAERHAQDGVEAARALLVGAFAVLPALGGVVTLVVEVQQGGDGWIRLEDHAAAVPAVTPVGAAARHVLLTPEADAARPAVATPDEDVDLVDEHCVTVLRRCRTGSGALLGDADVLVVALALEEHVAVGLGEERVVHAQTHVRARLEAGPPLPDQDAAGGDELPAEALHPEHLGIGVAAVPGAADTLLVSHGPRPRSW